MLCEFCLKPIRKTQVKIHTNIKQKVKIRHFCSKQCKENWQKEILSSTNKVIPVWRLAKVKNKVIFVKLSVSIEKYPLPIATKLNISHFSNKLDLMSDGELLAHILGFTSNQIKRE